MTELIAILLKSGAWGVIFLSLAAYETYMFLTPPGYSVEDFEGLVSDDGRIDSMTIIADS